MCKYCESKKPIQLATYNNRDVMDISYGQYQGVNVNASISMHGNMIMLNGRGSYRSKSDCYYEDCGLDCDNQNSRDNDPEIFQINFCPFCGRNLSDANQYNVEDANRKFAANKERIKDIEHRISLHNVVYANIKYDSQEIGNKLEKDIFGENPDYTDRKFISEARRKYEEEMKKHIEDVCTRPIESFDDIYFMLVNPDLPYSAHIKKDICDKENAKIVFQGGPSNGKYYINSSYFRCSDEEIDEYINNGKLHISMGSFSEREVGKKSIQEIRDTHEKNIKELDHLKQEQIRLKEIIKK